MSLMPMPTLRPMHAAGRDVPRVVQRVLVAGAVLAATGCAGLMEAPTAPGRLTGVVTYRDPVPLPSGAVVRVALVELTGQESDAQVRSEETIRPSGQVPVRFLLAYEPTAADPARRHGVRASITDGGGQVLWETLEPMAVRLHEEPGPLEVIVYRVGAAGRTAWAYQCGDRLVEASFQPEEVILRIAERTLALPRVPAASGAKYGAGATTFWSKGEEAVLEVDGVSYGTCRRGPAATP
jgi:putative lipoprotein